MRKIQVEPEITHVLRERLMHLESIEFYIKELSFWSNAMKYAIKRKDKQAGKDCKKVLRGIKHKIECACGYKI